ncbi:MAG TPA: hypothetical protein DCK95_06315 [Anaerolineaceae bacterium]|nr:hypothetical protein [Anaerolineaceae bacterium]
MCGRFTITLEPAAWQEEFDLHTITVDWKINYNTAPTQMVPVVIDAQSRSIEMMRWGLIPFGAKDESTGNRLINARAETLQEKPSFRNAFQQRRCLILADGFYEWQKGSTAKAPKVPYYFHLRDHKPFFFAGLWESWRSEKDAPEIHSCTIITTAPNPLVSEVHNRMPAILDKNTCWAWLEENDTNQLQKLLMPYPAELMQSYPVSSALNNPAINNAQNIQPLRY